MKKIDIPGYEGKYSATEDGNIWSYPKRRGSKNGQFLKPWIVNSGYLMVNISGNKELVHRVVAQSFIENPKNLPCVNHKNGIKTDNRIENLEWASYSDNTTHSYKVLKQKPPRSSLGKFGILNSASKPVLGICTLTGKEYLFDSAMSAQRNGFCQAHVSSCARGEVKHHKKIAWSYISKDEYLNRTQGYVA